MDERTASIEIKIEKPTPEILKALGVFPSPPVVGSAPVSATGDGHKFHLKDKNICRNKTID